MPPAPSDKRAQQLNLCSRSEASRLVATSGHGHHQRARHCVASSSGVDDAPSIGAGLVIIGRGIEACIGPQNPTRARVGVGSTQQAPLDRGASSIETPPRLRRRAAKKTPLSSSESMDAPPDLLNHAADSGLSIDASLSTGGMRHPLTSGRGRRAIIAIRGRR